MADLNTPLQVGDFEIKNRLVLAPMTRVRSDETRIPNSLMEEYYQQRANAGLIITEATAISPKAVAYANSPALWSQEQAQGWSKIVQAVHAQGAKIVAQLWHAGRITHPDLLDGDIPVAPSAIQPAGEVSLLRPKRPYVKPRALTHEEIQDIIAQHKYSAELAKQAGFDGVELHAGNGYLVDQFLQSSTNHRDDQYGGSVENRARLLLQIVDAFIEVWGAGKVGVHISPRGDTQDMGDENPLAIFSYVVEQLDQRNIAFIYSREYEAEDSILPKLRPKFKGVWIANEKLTAESAKRILASGQADAVAFGKTYVANPDLFHRLQNDLPLNEVQFETLFSSGPQGYIDYPTHQAS